MIRCIAIDQDRETLTALCGYIEQIPYLALLDVFMDVVKANLYLWSHPVDLIIMETQVSGISMFELIRELKQVRVIILTSCADEALMAYEAGTTDYMLKLLRLERLLKATNKLIGNTVPALYPFAPPYEAGQPLFVKEGNKIVRLRREQILFLQGYGDYVKIHLVDGKPLLSQASLKKFEEAVQEANFCRVHRLFIVALSQINYIERKRIWIGKAFVPISKSYFQSFLNWLELQ